LQAVRPGVLGDYGAGWDQLVGSDCSRHGDVASSVEAAFESVVSGEAGADDVFGYRISREIESAQPLSFLV